MQDPLFTTLATQLKNGLPFPEGHKEGDPRTAVFQLLFGAIMGLAEAKRLIDEAGDSLSAVIKTHELVDDFLSSKDASSPWDGTRSLRAWSIGYFIGKSASNISAALDRVVNIHIAHKYPALLHLDDAVFFASIPSRLRFAGSLSPEWAHLLSPVAATFQTELFHTESAYREIIEHGHLWEYPPRLNEFTPGGVSDKEARALVIMWTRNNAFKHQAKHYERFLPADLTDEFVMATIALHAMLKIAEALRT